MIRKPAQVAASIDTLTNTAFEAFCEDIVSMFGNNAECADMVVSQGPFTDLQKDFKKLVAVNRVSASGILDGTFSILLDQAGLFVLAGVFVMLPEKRINETIRNGTLKDADYINDAIKEVGNLLIGSWDRVFRQELKSQHKHLKQTGTFIGSIWQEPQECVGIESDGPCRYIVCRMKVDDFPEFKCAAVFPNEMFEEKSEPAATDPEPQTEAAPAAEPQIQAPEPPQAAAEPEPSDPVQQEPQASAQAEPVQTPAQDTDTPAAEPTAAAIATPDIPEPLPAAAVEQPGPVAQAIQHLVAQAEPSVKATPAAAAPQCTAAQLMNSEVLWVEPGDTIETVRSRMQQQNTGYALVGSEGRIEGIVSATGIAAAISPYTRSIFAHLRRPVDDASLQIRVKWFMSSPVYTVRPDAGLVEIVDTMLRRAIRCLPVVDQDGKTCGLITAWDLLTLLLGEETAAVTGRPRQSPGPV